MHTLLAAHTLSNEAASQMKTVPVSPVGSPTDRVAMLGALVRSKGIKRYEIFSRRHGTGMTMTTAKPYIILVPSGVMHAMQPGFSTLSS